MRRSTASCKQAECETTGLFYLVSVSWVSTLPNFHSRSKREKKATEIVITRLGRFAWFLSCELRLFLRVDTMKQICFFVFFFFKIEKLFFFMLRANIFKKNCWIWALCLRLGRCSCQTIDHIFFLFLSNCWGYEGPEYSQAKKKNYNNKICNRNQDLGIL